MTLIDVSNAKIWETDVIQSNIPVVVDFWAEWCGPCKIISPIIDELAKEYEGRVKFAKVNIDEANELASKYNVLSIPTLLIFNNGEVVVQNVGSSTKENYSKIIDKVLKK